MRLEIAKNRVPCSLSKRSNILLIFVANIDNVMKREKEKVKSVTESGKYFAKRNSLANSLLCLVFNMKIFSRIQNRMSRKNSTSPTTD